MEIAASASAVLNYFAPTRVTAITSTIARAPSAKTSKAASIGPICRLSLDCYRKVMNFIRAHPDDYEPDFEAIFQELVNRLDPPIVS